MPGISFLFKKRFHPARLDNQKKLFIREETISQRDKQEKEKSLQVAKERELQAYEGLGEAPDRDPRNSSLKFMYNAPAASNKKNDDKGRKVDLLAKPQPAALDENGDDEFVRQFRAKFIKRPFTTTGSEDHTQQNTEDIQLEATNTVNDSQVVQVGDIVASSSSSSSSDHRQYSEQRQLEKDVGRRQSSMPSYLDQADRHPVFKNAPVEGSYAHNIAVRHKPFSEVVRNVRCLRCGQWGHKSGERECPMRDVNPLDAERQRREDPMNSNNQYGYQDDGDSSDPEAEFLKTLTRREKKLLLRRLDQLEGVGGEEEKAAKKQKKSSSRKRKRKSYRNSSSDSSDTSSD